MGCKLFTKLIQFYGSHPIPIYHEFYIISGLLVVLIIPDLCYTKPEILSNIIYPIFLPVVLDPPLLYEISIQFVPNYIPDNFQFILLCLRSVYLTIPYPSLSRYDYICLNWLWCWTHPIKDVKKSKGVLIHKGLYANGRHCSLVINRCWSL